MSSKIEISMFPELQHKTPFRNRILIIWMVVRLVLISAWLWSYFIFFTSTFKNSLTIQIYNKTKLFPKMFNLCCLQFAKITSQKLRIVAGKNLLPNSLKDHYADFFMFWKTFLWIWQSSDFLSNFRCPWMFQNQTFGVNGLTIGIDL